MSVAHKLAGTKRTSDVLINESVDFAGLLLSKPVLQGLTKSGFERPSPIQLKAIPLGRCGLDLIVQAKSGTGKTCVFTVVALESLELASVCVQTLVLAPTREIAIQIQEVMRSVGSCMPGLKCHTFIGGLPIMQDKILAKNCHIAVGTPGRVKQLIQIGALKTASIRLFILDEADKLLEEGNFQESINWIYSSLPDNKQILALSATYPEYLANHLKAYMRNPTFVRLNITDPALIGIKQYHVVVPNHPLPNVVFNSKLEIILQILSSVTFQQCLIFSNMQSKAENLQAELQARNWPTACIAGCLSQTERNQAMEQLKSYKCRILISTDLTSRGIDADKVNLVINLDVPHDHETYLHRIGRAGRFGSYGAAVTIVSSGGQDKELWSVERKCKTYIHKLPDPIPKDLVTKTLVVKLDDVVSIEQIINQPELTFQDSLSEEANHKEKSTPSDLSSKLQNIVEEKSSRDKTALSDIASIPHKAIEENAFLDLPTSLHESVSDQTVFPADETKFETGVEKPVDSDIPCDLPPLEVDYDSCEQSDNSDEATGESGHSSLQISSKSLSSEEEAPLENKKELVSELNSADGVVKVERPLDEQESLIYKRQERTLEVEKLNDTETVSKDSAETPDLDKLDRSEFVSRDPENSSSVVEIDASKVESLTSTSFYTEALSQLILRQAMESSVNLQKVTAKARQLIGSVDQAEETDFVGKLCLTDLSTVQYSEIRDLSKEAKGVEIEDAGKVFTVKDETDVINSTVCTIQEDLSGVQFSKTEKGKVGQESSRPGTEDVDKSSNAEISCVRKEEVEVSQPCGLETPDRIGDGKVQEELECNQVIENKIDSGAVTFGVAMSNAISCELKDVGQVDSVSCDEPVFQSDTVSCSSVLDEIGHGDAIGQVNGVLNNVVQSDSVPSSTVSDEKGQDESVSNEVVDVSSEISNASNELIQSHNISNVASKSDNSPFEKQTSGRERKDRKPRSFELSLFLQQLNESHETLRNTGEMNRKSEGTMNEDVTESDDPVMCVESEGGSNRNNSSLEGQGVSTDSKENRLVSDNEAKMSVEVVVNEKSRDEKNMTEVASACETLQSQKDKSGILSEKHKVGAERNGHKELTADSGVPLLEVKTEIVEEELEQERNVVGEGFVKPEEASEIDTDVTLNISENLLSCKVMERSYEAGVLSEKIGQGEWLNSTKLLTSVLIPNGEMIPRKMTQLREDCNKFCAMYSNSPNDQGIPISSLAGEILQHLPETVLRVNQLEQQHVHDLHRLFQDKLQETEEQAKTEPVEPKANIKSSGKEQDLSEAVIKFPKATPLERPDQSHPPPSRDVSMGAKSSPKQGKSRPSDSLNWRERGTKDNNHDQENSSGYSVMEKKNVNAQKETNIVIQDVSSGPSPNKSESRKEQENPPSQVSGDNQSSQRRSQSKNVSKDEECQQLDDMHATMMKKRKERKLEREKLKQLAAESAKKEKQVDESQNAYTEVGSIPEKAGEESSKLQNSQEKSVGGITFSTVEADSTSTSLLNNLNSLSREKDTNEKKLDSNQTNIQSSIGPDFSDALVISGEPNENTNFNKSTKQPQLDSSNVDSRISSTSPEISSVIFSPISTVTENVSFEDSSEYPNTTEVSYPSGSNYLTTLEASQTSSSKYPTTTEVSHQRSAKYPTSLEVFQPVSPMYSTSVEVSHPISPMYPTTPEVSLPSYPIDLTTPELSHVSTKGFKFPTTPEVSHPSIGSSNTVKSPHQSGSKFPNTGTSDVSEGSKSSVTTELTDTHVSVASKNPDVSKEVSSLPLSTSEASPSDVSLTGKLSKSASSMKEKKTNKLGQDSISLDQYHPKSKTPKKPSKTEGRVAGLEVSDGSTSTSSGFSLSSSTEESALELETKTEHGASSQSYTNKSAEEEGDSVKKSEKTRKAKINSSLNQAALNIKNKLKSLSKPDDKPSKSIRPVSKESKAKKPASKLIGKEDRVMDQDQWTSLNSVPLSETSTMSDFIQSAPSHLQGSTHSLKKHSLDKKSKNKSAGMAQENAARNQVRTLSSSSSSSETGSEEADSEHETTEESHQASYQRLCMRPNSLPFQQSYYSSVYPPSPYYAYPFPYHTQYYNMAQYHGYPQMYTMPPSPYQGYCMPHPYPQSIRYSPFPYYSQYAMPLIPPPPMYPQAHQQQWANSVATPTRTNLSPAHSSDLQVNYICHMSKTLKRLEKKQQRAAQKLEE